MMSCASSLLLHPLQASTIKPSSQDDLDFLWGVSYCLRLTAPHAQRLAAAVRGLLDGPGGVGRWVPEAGQAARVEAALRGWLQPQRSVAEVEQERTAAQQRMLSIKTKQAIDSQSKCRQLYGAQAAAMLCTLLPWPLPGGCASEAVGNEVRWGKGDCLLCWLDPNTRGTPCPHA